MVSHSDNRMVTYYLALFLIVYGFVRRATDAPQQLRVQPQMQN